MRFALASGVAVSLLAGCAAGSLVPRAAADEKPAAPARSTSTEPAVDPALAKLGELIGGVWVGRVKGLQGDATVETRYERALDGKAIRCRGIIGLGGSTAMETEAYLGWDAASRSVYYIDFHGPEDVLKGTVRVEGKTLVTEISRLVGPPASWVSVDELIDQDTLAFTLYSVADGKRTKLFQLEMKRRDETAAERKPEASGELRQPALKKLERMIGGRWQSAGKGPDGKPFAEWRYAWGMNGRLLEGTGVIAGRECVSRIGWDPVAKKLFYLDFHGAGTAYFGHVTPDGEDMIFDFKTLIGAPAAYRSRASFPGPDSYRGQIQQLKDGEYRDMHTVILSRVP